MIATIIDPLREEWTQVLSTAERQKASGRNDAAADTVKRFHDKLCETTVLDPACGTGNFLYVSLELMKRLEGEVLEAIADLGGQDVLSGLSSHTSFSGWRSTAKPSPLPSRCCGSATCDGTSAPRDSYRPTRS